MSLVLMNDCHIHLGDSKSLNNTVCIEDVLEHKQYYNILNMLVMDTDLDHLKQLLDKDVYGIWGLQWITEHTTIDDLDHSSKIIGCKFHGAYANHPRPSNSVLEQLDRFGAILMMHTGRYKDANYTSNTSFLHSIDIAQRYPNIKLIMAHMGGTDTGISKLAVDMAKDFPNVLFDTSGITSPSVIEYAVDIIGSQRILFGSDIPWCSFRAMYYTVDDARIPEIEKDNIFYHSLNRLLK